MAFLYVPNGTIPAAWWPSDAADAPFKLSETLQPLQKVKDQVQLIAGLDDVSANPGRDGGGDHARAGGTFLTGVRIKKTAGSDIYAGVSFDQVIAQKIGHLTRFPSLELSCDAIRKAGDCDTGYSCAYEYNLAWRTPTQLVTPDANPRLVFERLFGDGPANERAANPQRRQTQQQSILDFVLTRREDAGIFDERTRPARSWTNTSRVSGRLSSASSARKKMPAANPAQDAPAGIPPNFAEHIQIMFDMMLLAFQTDSTRIATMMLAGEGSNRTFPEIGLSEGHHNLTHHQGDWR